tara:strand:- start:38692 stop:39348 length:657 start_codon:yes stop_codon:yes gene_type:complete
VSEFYILHKQPLREQEWLLDIFSQQDGRLSVIAGPRQRHCDSLQLMQGRWSGHDDWPQVRVMECLSELPFSGNALYCALYITELLARLLPRYEPSPALFHSYRQTLNGLAGGGLPDPWLRLFEVQLLSGLGYGFSWQQDASGHVIEDDIHYDFVPGQGFVGPAVQGIAGRDIIGFARRERNNPAAWLAAKKILRRALDDLLERPLTSRELISVSKPNS